MNGVWYGGKFMNDSDINRESRKIDDEIASSHQKKKLNFESERGERRREVLGYLSDCKTSKDVITVYKRICQDKLLEELMKDEVFERFIVLCRSFNDCFNYISDWHYFSLMERSIYWCLEKCSNIIDAKKLLIEVRSNGIIYNRRDFDEVLVKCYLRFCSSPQEAKYADDNNVSYECKSHIYERIRELS